MCIECNAFVPKVISIEPKLITVSYTVPHLTNCDLLHILVFRQTAVTGTHMHILNTHTGSFFFFNCFGINHLPSL